MIAATRRLGLAAVALVGAAVGQEQLRVQGPTPATVVLGSSARVDLVVEGRGADPERPRVPAVDGLSVRVLGPSRQSFSQITPRGVTEQLTVTWTLVLRPEREGTFTIPSFPLDTGSHEQAVPDLKITVIRELRGAEFGFLEVEVAPQRVYVHEPIRARVRFGVDAGLQPVQDVAGNGTRYLDFEVQAPWLSQMEGAEPLDVPEPTGDRVPIVLNRRLLLAAFDAAVARGDKRYRTFAFEKAFLPTRPGTLELAAPLLRYHVQLERGRQGLFGERVGGRSQNYYVYGEPVEVEVLPIPDEGRPQPYYGAVGRFELAATTDRDTVEVGSSVKLLLAIRGSGNFEFLRVPDLSALEQQGLHLLGQTEERSSDEVLVTYDLTPLSADVEAIPGIEWNFFDTTPGVERFVTVTTERIPLDVQPLADGETLVPLPDADHAPVTPGVDDIFDLPALDGAAVPTPSLPRSVAWAAAVGPWLAALLVLALLAWYRRRSGDPAAVRARRAARTCERALAAGEEPTAALAGYLGDRMGVPAAAVIGPDLAARLQGAGVDAALAGEVAAAIDTGVAGRYGGSGGLDESTVRALVARLEQAPLRARPGAAAAGAGLLLAIALVADAGPAQQQPPQRERGVQAYRDGDYAAAEQAFAQALERRDDRRLWFARGNCFYRMGDLPRARWAYECARLGLPRDRELLANLQLVRRRLQLPDEEQSFTAAVAVLRDRFTAPELAVACGLAMAAAALLLGLGRRRVAMRWLGAVALVPGLLLAVELLWLRPARPDRAVALRSLALVAEPRDDLEPVARVEPGVVVTWRSGARASGDYVRVAVGEHLGYVPRRDVARIR